MHVVCCFRHGTYGETVVYRTTPIFLRATGRLVLNLIKPLRMLRDRGNADEENQDADDIGLEP